MAEQNYQSLMNLPGDSPLFGLLAMRDLVLPELLGTDDAAISYFAGRALARQLPVAEENLERAFTQLGFGELIPDHAKRQMRQYRLTGTTVETRIVNFKNVNFQLEAGFLAQSLQQILGVVVEANATIERHKKEAVITVALDPKDEQPLTEMTIDLD